MRTRLLIAVILVLLGALLLVQIAIAMSSSNYRLDWFTLLTTGGGGAASSTNYAINLTIGQSAAGTSSSANYQAGLGYWSGVSGSYRVFLPLIMK
jgi:hypothetical protein